MRVHVSVLAPLAVPDVPDRTVLVPCADNKVFDAAEGVGTRVYRARANEGHLSFSSFSVSLSLSLSVIFLPYRVMWASSPQAFPNGVIPHPLVSMHVRHGDKYKESFLISLDEYVRALKESGIVEKVCRPTYPHSTHTFSLSLSHPYAITCAVSRDAWPVWSERHIHLHGRPEGHRRHVHVSGIQLVLDEGLSRFQFFLSFVSLSLSFCMSLS